MTSAERGALPGEHSALCPFDHEGCQGCDCWCHRGGNTEPDRDFEMACGAVHELPDYGDVAGWLVLTVQPDGSLQPDWDGALHPTYEAGQEAIRAASSGSCCILVVARRVPSNTPTPGRSPSDG